MDSGDAAWVLVSAALVLFMTPGLAFFYGGMDRTRNVLNMLMMNFCCLLIIPVLWVVGRLLAGAGAVRERLHRQLRLRVPARTSTSVTTAASLATDRVPRDVRRRSRRR